MSTYRIEKLAAMGGVVFVVLQLAGQMLIQVGGSEPPFTAPSDEILDFFAARDELAVSLGEFFSLLSLFGALAFAGALWAGLRRIDERSQLLPFIASGSIVVLVALAFAGFVFWGAAIFRIDEGLDGPTAQVLFDLGNMTFANMWVAAAGATFAVGIAAFQSTSYPSWLGWTSLALGLSLLLGRWFWDAGGAAFAPYVLFWLWLIVTGVLLWRRVPAQS